MKKSLCFTVVLVCTVMMCLSVFAEGIDLSYTEVAFQSFENSPVLGTDYAATSTGGSIELNTDANYAHTGKSSIKRTVSGLRDRGIKAVGILNSILKAENVGKKYRISAYIYVPDTAQPSYNFLVSTVEASGSTLRNKSACYNIKPNTWEKLTMYIQLTSSDITNNTNSVRICQRDVSTDETCANVFYADDFLVEEITQTVTDAEEGFVNYSFTDCEDDAFASNFTLYSDNFTNEIGYKNGGGLGTTSTSVTAYSHFSGKKSIRIENRTSDAHRIKVSGLLPIIDSSYIGKIIKVSAYMRADSFTDESKNCQLGMWIMTDASTSAIYTSYKNAKKGEYAYIEQIFTVTQSFVDKLNGYPARIAFQSNGGAVPKILYIDDISVDIAEKTIEPNAYFSDNAVFQRDKNIKVFGTGTKDGVEVTVELCDEVKKTTVSGGKWMVEFSPKSAAKNVNFKISEGSLTKTYKNIAIGEVWMCAGQSNMQFTMQKVSNAEEIFANCTKYDVRFIDQKEQESITGEKSNLNQSKWYISDSAESVKNMSAVSYIMAYQLEDSLDVTIGLVDIALGGTRIDAWLSEETLNSRSEYSSSVSRLASIRENGTAIDKYTPTALYNGMYAPMRNIAARGLLWYQGESNASSSYSANYDLMLEDLIAQYRKDQNNPDFPVVAMMLAPYQTSNNFSKIRQYTLDVSKRLNNVYVISTSNEGPDGTETSDNLIHPNNKIPVGNRIYRAVMANVYNDIIPFEGTWNAPIYKSISVNGNKAVLSFDCTGNGIKTTDGEALKGFEISDDGVNFVTASATISGNKVEVYAESVANPCEVRYCYTNISSDGQTLGGNLTNETLIPAVPFRASALDADGEMTVDSKNVKCIISNDGYSSVDVNVIFALYDKNGALKAVRINPVKIPTVGRYITQNSFDSIEEGDNVRAFVFESKSFVTPVMKSMGE